ncbi:MAG: class I SAM-dependent methyltransferase [Acidimicrobiia bacterium]
MADFMDRALKALSKTPLRPAARVVIARLPARPRRWIEERKRRLHEEERERRLHPTEPLVPERELEATYRDALRLLLDGEGPNHVGDYLEFGVYVGTSILCMHRASKAVGLGSLRLFGFDSFQGLPETAARVDEGPWQPGQYWADYGFVRKRLAKAGIDWSRTTLVPGWFEETLRPTLARKLGIHKAGIVMIDCDIYSSARTALGSCAPLIQDRAVIVFDDWNSGGLAAQGLGERRAFEEFMAGNPDLGATELETYHENAKVFLITRMETGTREAPVE